MIGPEKPVVPIDRAEEKNNAQRRKQQHEKCNMYDFFSPLIHRQTPFSFVILLWVPMGC